jgi:hypothetical protein
MRLNGRIFIRMFAGIAFSAVLTVAHSWNAGMVFFVVKGFLSATKRAGRYLILA